jgi:DNA topoisomerase I
MDDPIAAARSAGLRYVDDGDPGVSRRRHGRGFVYRDSDGQTVHDQETLKRIRSLAIPPAWENVWISPTPHGHIQATGRDKRGRKQYRYHPLWRVVRDEAKYDRVLAFATALPKLRRRVARDLARAGLPRPKMVALVVRLLETTLLRVGNEEYVRDNRSFGLTTLRNRHVRVRGSEVRFSFRGKAGKNVEVGLLDRRLARLMRRVQELPGQRLFQYVDENGDVQPIDSDDVNDYLRTVMGDDFSAKDFRTWVGTVLAVRALRAIDAESSDGPDTRHEPEPTPGKVVRAVREVARSLGNTAAVCRRCYIHPQVLDAYLDGSLAKLEAPGAGVRNAERFVLHLLRSRASASAHKTPAAA